MNRKYQSCMNSPYSEPGRTNRRFFQFFFLLSLILGIAASFHTVLPNSMSLLAVYGLLCCGYLGVVFSILVYRGRIPNSVILWAWFMIGIYLLLIGFVLGNPLSSESRSTFLHQDLRYYMYVTIGIIASRKEFRPWVLKIMNFMGYLSIVFGILSLISITPTTTAMARMQVWTLPYFYWWLSGSCFAINYAYMRMTGKNKIAGIGAMAVYVICGVMFLKKVVIVNSLLLVFICEMLAPDSKLRNRGFLFRFFKSLLALAVIVGIVAFLATRIEALQNIIDLIVNRFKQASDSFDRLVEFELYLKNSSPIELILGRGYGNYAYLQDQYVGGYYQGNAMHIGLADIPYVGGIPYSLVWIAIFVTVLKRIKHVKEIDNFHRACLAVVCLSCISLLYEFSRTSYISPFFAGIAFTTVLSYPHRLSNKLHGENVNFVHENML